MAQVSWKSADIAHLSLLLKRCNHQENSRKIRHVRLLIASLNNNQLWIHETILMWKWHCLLWYVNLTLAWLSLKVATKKAMANVDSSCMSALLHPFLSVMYWSVEMVFPVFMGAFLDGWACWNLLVFQRFLQERLTLSSFIAIMEVPCNIAWAKRWSRLWILLKGKLWVTSQSSPPRPPIYLAIFSVIIAMVWSNILDP